MLLEVPNGVKKNRAWYLEQIHVALVLVQETAEGLNIELPWGQESNRVFALPGTGYMWVTQESVGLCSDGNVGRNQTVFRPVPVRVDGNQTHWLHFLFYNIIPVRPDTLQNRIYEF